MKTAGALLCGLLFTTAVTAEPVMTCFSETEMKFAAEFDTWTVAMVTPFEVRHAGAGRGQSVFLKGETGEASPEALPPEIEINAPGHFPNLRTGSTFVLLLASFDSGLPQLWRIAGAVEAKPEDAARIVAGCRAEMERFTGAK